MADTISHQPSPPPRPIRTTPSATQLRLTWGAPIWLGLCSSRLVEKVRTFPVNTAEQMVAARDYEALERLVLEHLLG